MLLWQPTSEERDQNTRREEPIEHRFWCCTILKLLHLNERYTKSHESYYYKK